MRVKSIVFAALIALAVPAHADGIFTWSGLPIAPEPPDGVDPSFLPSGTATFEISGSTLTLTLVNTTTDTLKSNWHALSGFVWDITDAGVGLTMDQALIASGSQLVDNDGNEWGTDITDLSSEWAYKSDISAGSSVAGTIGPHGVGSIGDINFGADTFGVNDRFDTTTNLFGPASLNGLSGAIIGSTDYFDPNGGFKDPVVSNSMVFSWTISGTLTLDEIVNGQPLFGTNGVTLVPEPGTLGLFGLALGGFWFWRRRR